MLQIFLAEDHQILRSRLQQRGTGEDVLGGEKKKTSNQETRRSQGEKRFHIFLDLYFLIFFIYKRVSNLNHNAFKFTIQTIFCKHNGTVLKLN